jgi:hypothetical protein
MIFVYDLHLVTLLTLPLQTLRTLLTLEHLVVVELDGHLQVQASELAQVPSAAHRGSSRGKRT